MVFDRLYQDHDNLRMMLNLLEQQCLEMYRDRPVDYAVLHSIVVYVQEYPEQFHHPLEDSIFSLVLSRGRKNSSLLRELMQEHTELEDVSRRLRALLEAIMSGDKAAAGDLKGRLSEFLLRQRRHLFIEESLAFPAIIKGLTPQDMDALAALMPAAAADPVFGDRTRSEYEVLYRALNG